MTTSTSYRLDPELKQRLADQAAREQITETALVTRLLEEGLKVAAHPGVVYRDGPTGRRAAIAGGPDVWEVITGVRHAAGRGDRKVREAALGMGLPDGWVRLAIDFAAANPDEIEERIALNEVAADEVAALTEARARLLGE